MTGNNWGGFAWFIVQFRIDSVGVGSIVQHMNLRATEILSDICGWARSVMILSIVSIDSNTTGVDSHQTLMVRGKLPLILPALMRYSNRYRILRRLRGHIASVK